MSRPPKSRRPRRTPPTIDLKASAVTQAPPDADRPAQKAAPSADPSPDTAESALAETVMGSSPASASGLGGSASAIRRARVYGGTDPAQGSRNGAAEDRVPGAAAPDSGLVAGEALTFPAGDPAATAPTETLPNFPAADPIVESRPEATSSGARVPDTAGAGGRDGDVRERADPPAPRRTGFAPLLGAGALGGVIGAALSLFAAPFLTPASRPDPRIAVLEERLGAVPPRDQIGSLERRLSTLEGERTGLDGRLREAQATAERGVARAEEALNRPVPAGDGQAAPATGAPAAASGVPATALAELTARLDALEGRVRQQDASPAATPPGATALASVLDERLAGLARQVDTLENALRQQPSPAQAAAPDVEPRLAEQDRRLAEVDGRLNATRDRAQELTGAVQALQSSSQASEQALRGVEGTLSGLEPALRSLQGAVQPLPEAIAGLDRRLGEQDGRLSALSQQIEGQDGRLATLDQRSQAQDGRLAEIGQRLGAQDGRLGEIGQQLRGQDERLAVLGQGAQAQDARLATLNRQFAERDPALPIRIVAADRVSQALEDGAPYPAALDALKRLGGDPARLGPLEPFATTGAPTAAVLAAEFQPLAERMIRDGRPPAVTLADRLKRMAGEVVTVRPVGETEGTDVESLVARVDGALGRGAIAEAAAAFEALPEAARAPAEAFGRKLRERAAAEGAARQASADALAALAAPR